MAAPYLPVNSGVPWGGKLAKFREDLRKLVDLGRDLQGKANATVDTTPNPDSYVQTESVFGLTPIEGATGTDTAGYKVLFQLNSVMAKLDSDVQQDNAKTVIQQFLNEVG